MSEESELANFWRCSRLGWIGGILYNRVRIGIRVGGGICKILNSGVGKNLINEC